MSTAEELLCSRRWRLSRGLWMLLGWVPLAFTAWIGYLIIGVKSRNWRWIAIAIILFAFVIVTFVIVATLPVIEKGETRPMPDALVSDLVVWSWLIVWLGNALGLQLWINRRWLVWRAHNNKQVSTPWYATATATATANGVQPVDRAHVTTAIDTALAGKPKFAATGGTSDMQHFDSQRPIALDINTASQDQLVSLPGLDPHTAGQVIAARDAIGGFRDTADLVTRAGVKPHVFAGLMGHIMVSPGSHASAATPATAVPADPAIEPNGRRLEF